VAGEVWGGYDEEDIGFGFGLSHICDMYRGRFGE
jgi:hypothetical protein